MDISFQIIRQESEKIVDVQDSSASCVLYHAKNSITIQTYPKDEYGRRFCVAVKISGSAEKYTVALCDDEESHKSVLLKNIGEYYIIDDKINSSIYVNPGRSQIKIQDKNGNNIWQGSILVVPSNMTVKQFERMLNDILEFKLELLFSADTKQLQNKVSLQKRNVFSCMLEDLIKIHRTLVKISRNPHRNGKVTSVIANKNDIRSVDSDIIRQYIENPWRQNYKVKKLIEQSSNYENIVIFQMLKRLDDNIIKMISCYETELNSGKKKYKTRRAYLQRNDNRDINGFIQANDKEATTYIAKQKDYIQSLNDMHNILDSIFKLELFSKIKNKKHKSFKLKLTQVFSNDTNYKKIYSFLKKINNYQLESSLGTQENTIFIEKVPTLYEYWVLIKIIGYLTNLGFDCEKDISDVLDIIWQNKKMERSLEQRIIFAKDDIKIVLFYDTILSQSLKYLRRQKMTLNLSTTDLRPDYIFIVEIPDDEKIFILDAKYRKYDDMKTQWCYWYDNDLEKISKEKYIDRIKEEYDIDISMSFIVHTDMLNDNEIFSRTNVIQPNPNSYLGRYVTYDAENDSRLACFNTVTNIGEEDYATRKEHKYGSFYMVPDNGDEQNNSLSNLEKFFSLMFEFYMGQWKTYCWKCGEKINNEDIKEPPQTTRFPKYYVKCHNCGNLTVKNNCSNKACGNIPIIKHAENYFVEAGGGRWLLRCPRCGKV